MAETSAHRERLWPAFLAGIAAGFLGSVTVVVLDSTGFLAAAAICAVPSFVAALIATRFAPSTAR